MSAEAHTRGGSCSSRAEVSRARSSSLSLEQCKLGGSRGPWVSSLASPLLWLFPADLCACKHGGRTKCSLSFVQLGSGAVIHNELSPPLFRSSASCDYCETCLAYICIMDEVQMSTNFIHMNRFRLIFSLLTFTNPTLERNLVKLSCYCLAGLAC
jgi:hypothetical protein